MPVTRTKPTCADNLAAGQPLAEGYSTRHVPMIQLPPPGGNRGQGRRGRNVGLVIVGEAPGRHEDQRGEPFVGQSGKLLRSLIAYYQLPDYADVFLTNAVPYRPPDNRTPKPAEITACYPLLRADLDRVSGDYRACVVLAVGATAAKALGFPTQRDAFKHQGEIRDGLPTFVTYHPAALLRDQSLGTALDSHMQCLVRYLQGSNPRNRTGCPHTARNRWLVAPVPPRD